MVRSRRGRRLGRPAAPDVQPGDIHELGKERLGDGDDGRLRRGLSTADAVRDASLTVLRERRARRGSTHPFFWAGFVASGDWR